jgi:hypothetical protein
MSDKTMRLNVIVNRNLVRQVKSELALSGRTLSELVRYLLEHWLVEQLDEKSK